MNKLIITPDNETQIQSQLQTYIDNNDYTGAAAFMGKIRINNNNRYVRANLERQYHQMELQGHEYNGALNKTTDPVAKQAFAFSYSMSNKGNPGNLGIQNNEFYKQYANAIDNAFGKDTPYIAVRFSPKHLKRTGLFGIDWLAKDINHNESGQDIFLRQIGMSRDQLEDAGVKFHNNSDGTVSMAFSKADKGMSYKIFKALNLTNTKYDGSVDGYQDIDAKDAVPMFQLYGLDKNGSVKGVPKGIFGNKNSGDVASETNLVNSSNKTKMTLGQYSDSDAENAFTSNELNKIFGIQNEADKIYKDIVGDEKPHVMSTILMNTLDTHNWEELSDDSKALLNSYYNQLSKVDLSKYEIYSDFSGDDAEPTGIDDITREMHPIKEGSKRQNISTILHWAVANNKFSISDAVMGDKVGKYITIPLQTNGKNETTTKELNIFVKDLWSDSPESVKFANNTKTRALLEANAMQLYGYNMKVPDVYGNGEAILKPNADGTFTYYSSTGGGIKDMSKEVAQSVLNSNFIIQDGVRQIQDAAYNIDGTPRRGYDSKAAYSDLYNYVMAAVNETDPDTFNRLSERFKDYDVSSIIDSNGYINHSLANNDELISNDISQFNYLAQTYYRYIFGYSGLNDTFHNRDNGDYSN